MNSIIFTRAERITPTLAGAHAAPTIHSLGGGWHASWPDLHRLPLLRKGERVELLEFISRLCIKGFILHDCQPRGGRTLDGHPVTDASSSQLEMLTPVDRRPRLVLVMVFRIGRGAVQYHICHQGRIDRLASPTRLSISPNVHSSRPAG